jgi:hypothetical protein
MASFAIGVLSVHSHGGTKENNGKLRSVPGRYSIQALPDYKSASWSLLSWNLIIIRMKFIHRRTSFENSAPENVCVVWIICNNVTCILSSASVGRLERKFHRTKLV